MRPTVGQCMDGYLKALRDDQREIVTVGPEKVKSQLAKSKTPQSGGAITDGATDWDFYCYRIVRRTLEDFGSAATAYLHVAVFFSERGTIEGYQFANIKAASWVIVRSGKRPKAERMKIHLGAMAAASLKVFHDALRRRINESEEFEGESAA